ncbi:hypothetical protein LguiB_013727 [Lonicera macranthoides]
MMSTMATSSTQSNFSSSYLAPPRTWNYDVFLSFRGEDTRKNFTDHLHNALTRAGIRTFRDDDQLPRGKHIPFQLTKAIEESRISIIVFSKNYASSSWCLDELVKVLECKNTRGQLVLPVFYDVDPSDGTEAIEGISLVLPMTEETKISSTSFARINNLQLLKMHNVHVTGSLEHLSNQLRWLCWHHYPLKCLRSIFHMEKLVVLDMQYSKLNTIWKGSKFLKSLKILNLSHSNLLKGTMDFNGVPMLETLLLEGCTSLLEVHSSIGVLDKLAHLNLKEELVVDGCQSLQSLPKLPPNVEFVYMDNCTSVERLPDLSYSEKSIRFFLNECISLAERRNMVDTEHAGLPGPIKNKNISSPLFDIPATTEKKRTCYILFDIPSITEKNDYVELTFRAAYEAKTDGSVSTRISEVLDPHNASRYQRRRSCLSHFESRNRGNYYLVGDIKLENEIVGGERIEVCFEIAPSACIVVKVCLLQLSYYTCTGDYSKVNMDGRKIGFDLVETSGGLANKDYDSKRSSIIWKDVNNEEDEEDNEYIHMYSLLGILSIGSRNLDIYRFKKFLEST